MNEPLGTSTISLDDQNVYEGPYMNYLSIPPVALPFLDALDYLNPRNSMVEADVVNDVMDQFMPSEDEDTTSSTVSSTFHPLLLVGPTEIPDVILKSSDGVLFFVHSDRLLSASFNAFDGHLTLLSTDVGCFDIPETSEILSIILHIVYDISCVATSPTLTVLVTAVDTIAKYGLPTRILIGLNNSIFSVLYAHTPLHPIDIYALAAHHGIEPLAKLASGHLLSFVMHTLSSCLVERMGSRYMKRLYFLQLNRLAQLRGIVSMPPDYSCCKCKSDTMRSAWAWSAVSLVNDAKPGPSSSLLTIMQGMELMELGFVDLSPQLLVSLMRIGAGDVNCHCCKRAYIQRADTVGALWALVPASGFLSLLAYSILILPQATN